VLNPFFRAFKLVEIYKLLETDGIVKIQRYCCLAKSVLQRVFQLQISILPATLETIAVVV
jgi:hypothetical protein